MLTVGTTLGTTNPVGEGIAHPTGRRQGLMR